MLSQINPVHPLSLFKANSNIVTYRVVRVTKITGSSSDDWIY
jgi:hypothetical protein